MAKKQNYPNDLNLYTYIKTYHSTFTSMARKIINFICKNNGGRILGADIMTETM